MVFHQFEKRANFLEIFSSSHQPSFPVPIDEAGVVKLGQVGVVEFEPDRLLLSAFWSELHGFELRLSAWVVFHECSEDPASDRMAQHLEDLVQVDTTR